jgi:hypothetical protein
MDSNWSRYVARALALAWGGWWTFFGLASGIGERLTPLGVLVRALLPGGVFLATVLLIWRWERAGAVLLLLEALLAAAYAGLGRTWFMPLLLTLAQPLSSPGSSCWRAASGHPHSREPAASTGGAGGAVGVR